MDDGPASLPPAKGEFRGRAGCFGSSSAVSADPTVVVIFTEWQGARLLRGLQALVELHGTVLATGYGLGAAGDWAKMPSGQVPCAMWTA